jgi:crossover junction endodeoxyribonuclease RuvC
VKCFGIDPGSHRTGWGVIIAEGGRMTPVAAGVIEAEESAPLAERVAVIFAGLQQRLGEHRPDHVFLESVFHHKSVRSALVLGHARGVALLAARLADAQIDELSPAEVKKAVTGNGRAEKAQVQEMVRIILGLRERAQVDASDALAVAIAGSQRATSPIAQLMVRASRGTR